MILPIACIGIELETATATTAAAAIATAQKAKEHEKVDCVDMNAYFCTSYSNINVDFAAINGDVLPDGGAHEVSVHVHVSVVLQLSQHAQVFERHERRYEHT